MPPELAPANSASSDALSDRAAPSDALDNSEFLNFEEPEEEQANQEAETSGAETNSETDAASIEDGDQEADETAGETETETEGTEGEKPETTVKDDVVVDVNGEKLPLSELKSGYMKTADYTRKTQEVANKRRDLETLSTRVTQSVNAIADLLVRQLPPAPDTTLAMTDPAKYVQDKAMHDAMMAQITAVIDQANTTKDVVNKLTAEQRSELLQSENAKLAEAFPQTTKPESRKKFFDDVATVAKDLGYSQAELETVSDHRVFKLAYYAKLGMEAEKAKAKAAQKVVNAPPMTPNKRPQGAVVKANKDAMKRLNQTGSIKDAMLIDID